MGTYLHLLPLGVVGIALLHQCAIISIVQCARKTMCIGFAASMQSANFITRYDDYHNLHFSFCPFFCYRSHGTVKSHKNTHYVARSRPCELHCMREAYEQTYYIT